MTKPKKVRFYYNGKRRKDIYPENTQWEVFKWNVKTFFKSYSILLILIVIFGSGTYLHFRANADYCGLTAVQCLLEE